MFVSIGINGFVFLFRGQGVPLVDLVFYVVENYCQENKRIQTPNTEMDALVSIIFCIINV